MKSFFKSIYLGNRIYFVLTAIAVLFLVSHFFPVVYPFAQYALLVASALFIIDFLMLYTSSRKQIFAKRIVPERLSNGDINQIEISITNNYTFPVNIKVIDEIPFQFQKRDFEIEARLNSVEIKNILYNLRPVERGEYSFGKLNIYAGTIINFISKRFVFDAGVILAVYPSFIQMRKYELLAISNNLVNQGIKKIRRVSNNSEFETIKDYIGGDDFRTVNWKATSRRSKLMVNQYQDEKSQQVFSVIDMGRTMRMPFREMSLLDYAINASLVISNIAIKKHDKAGLITFSKRIHTNVPASNKVTHVNSLMNALYNQATDFLESDHEQLFINVKQKVHQRSLLLYFTNFEGLPSLERQLPYFKMLTKNHLLVVIFFENTELMNITNVNPAGIEEIYIKTVAEKLSYEKRLIVKELKKNAIHAVLTAPEHLTINTINKYLELKARGLI